MNPIILALAIVCTNPPDANGNLAADCITAACPNMSVAISDYLKEGKKLSKPDKIDLGKAILWHNKNCAGKG